MADEGAPCDRELEALRAEVAGLRAQVQALERRVGDDPAAELFEMSLDNLCVASLDGYLKRVNPAWTRTLGWTVEELLARPSIELVHPDDRPGVLEARQRLAAGEPLRVLANRYRCKDGSYRWLEWRSVPHVDRGVVYAAARDVTEQRAAQEAIEQLRTQLAFADRMASVGTLAAGVAHEINTPLAYVLANLEMLAEELRAVGPGAPGRPGEWTELVRDASEGAERIRTIVRGLQTFARVEDERRTIISVIPLVDLSIDLTLHEVRPRATLVRDFGPVPDVHADEARLGQVFINLLVNATQAIGDGHPADHEIRITTSTDGEGRAVIEVRDTGPGIPAEVRARVFDPFFTTKPIGVGPGLGLSVCHNIVTAMGGTVTARNHAERGAVFRVVLPPAPGLPPASPPASSSTPTPTSTPTSTPAR